MLTERRYDIDWLRVFAIGLLMIYHVAVVFQPWGLMIGFMTNSDSWESLWIPMTILNVWRIPLLFFISGMGMYFSFRNRNVKQLIAERLLRIFVPFVFGIFVVVPIYMLILQYYYQWKIEYTAHPSHLWFLGNIMSYVILSIPVFYVLKKYSSSLAVKTLQNWLNSIWGLLFVTGCFLLETILLKPAVYEMFALTSHGFVSGWLAFIFGYGFALSGMSLWDRLFTYRWVFLVLAASLFAIRTFHVFSLPYNVNLPAETCLWIFFLFGFSKKYVRARHTSLTYFSEASYPVYIIHMVFLGLSCLVVLPMHIGAVIKFFLVLMGTIAGSLICYELLIRRINVLRFLFGLKTNSAE